MKLPRLQEFSPEIPPKDVGRMMEAMWAGLEHNPPDSFVEDWQESVDEVKRVLAEVGDPDRSH
jgi:hypothetical protein